MTHGWPSIALACAFGALIGTLTVLEISMRFEYGSYLWSIGALVGGIAAYVVIDFRHFCAGVAHPYRRTVAWRPYSLWWKALAAMSGGIAVAYCSIVGVSGAVLAYVSDAPMSVAIGTLYMILGVSVLGALLGWLMTSESSNGANDAADRERRLRNTIEMGWNYILYGNPIGVALAVFCGLKWPRGAYSAPAIAHAVPVTINAMRHAGHTVAQLVVGVFVYIHSQRRTICFVDATIGATIGYFFGSAIIGAVAGALLGVINYEIVSVWWLRLVPASR
ncbi:MAG: hypothetical protein HYU05_01880 [Candidatus Wildermuthbacteria bacterium]|nr:hypothetical protein [Candidatus Wildermuthbacteria bacterium]